MQTVVHLQASAALVEAVASRWNGLVRPDDVKKKVLERDKDVEDLVTHERKKDERGRNHRVHEIVVGSRNNGDQNEGRVSKANKEIKDLPENILAHLAALQCTAEESRMVDHGHANAERVAKVHGRHCCKLVDILAAHPYTLCVVVADSIEEAILFGE